MRLALVSLILAAIMVGRLGAHARGGSPSLALVERLEEASQLLRDGERTTGVERLRQIRADVEADVVSWPTPSNEGENREELRGHVTRVMTALDDLAAHGQTEPAVALFGWVARRTPRAAASCDCAIELARLTRDTGADWFWLLRDHVVSPEALGLGLPELIATVTGRMANDQAVEADVLLISVSRYPASFPAVVELYRLAGARFPESREIQRRLVSLEIAADNDAGIIVALRRLVDLDPSSSARDTSRETDCESLILATPPARPRDWSWVRSPRPALLALVLHVEGREQAEDLARVLAGEDPPAVAELLLGLGAGARAAEVYRADLDDAVRRPPTRADALHAGRLVGLYRALNQPREAIDTYDRWLVPLAATFPSCRDDEFVANAALARKPVDRCGRMVASLLAAIGDDPSRVPPVLVTRPCLPVRRAS